MKIFKWKTALSLIIIFLIFPGLRYWIYLRDYADKAIVDEAGLVKDPEPFLIDSYFLKKYCDINLRVVTIMIRGFEESSDSQGQTNFTSSSDDTAFRSGGAGAKLKTDISSEEAEPEKIFLPESIKKDFDAGNVVFQQIREIVTYFPQMPPSAF